MVRVRPLFLVVLVLGSVPGLSAATTPQPAQQPSVPEPPAEVVAAWKKAGAEAGWLGPRRHFDDLHFVSERGALQQLWESRPTLPDLDPARTVPAFQFSYLQPGALPKLPVPHQRFGLHLDGAGMGDAGLKDLAGLKSLTTLQLSFSQMAGEGLKELAGLKHLTTIHLDRTGVTEAGVRELAALKKLTRLNLWGTEVTAMGMQELQKALPACRISKRI